jgi:hypothetical protein
MIKQFVDLIKCGNCIITLIALTLTIIEWKTNQLPFIILRLHNDIACGFVKRVYICNTNSTSSKFRTLMSGISSYQQQKKPSHI